MLGQQPARIDATLDVVVVQTRQADELVREIVGGTDDVGDSGVLDE
jgi:hypothetical protein